MNRIPLMLTHVVVGTGVVTASVGASITTFVDDKAGWAAAAGPYVKLDFVITPPDQQVPADYWYPKYGITLASKHVPLGCDWYLFQNGGSLDGWVSEAAGGFNPDPQSLIFDTPRYAFAEEEWATFLDTVGMSFYLGNQLVGVSMLQVDVFGPAGVHFFGWKTSFAFDRIVFLHDDPIDNMYFDIPAPGVLATLAGAGLLGRSSRRRRM